MEYLKNPTTTLVLAEVVVYLLTAFISFPVIQYFGFSLLALERGEIWTPLTSLFIHVNIFHLGINMFLLYVFGSALEGEERGAGKVLVPFFVGGVLSLFLGIAIYPTSTTIVGSSIGVSALIGATLVTIPMKQSPVFLFYTPLGLIATIYLVFNAFFAFSAGSTGGIAYPSHVIGFFVGVTAGFRGRRGLG